MFQRTFHIQSAAGRLVFVFMAAAAVLPAVVSAQGLLKEQGEVTGLAGGLFGEGSSLALGGGGYGAVSNRFAVGAEATYAPGMGESFGNGSSFSSSATEIHGGVQYLFDPSSNAQPYVAGGVGVFRVSASASAAGVGSASLSDSSLMMHVGGGVRYWVGDRWGVKPELKVLFGDTTLVRASVGVFFQFGE